MGRKTISGNCLPTIIEVYEAKKLNKSITNQECADILNEKFNCNFGESAWRKEYRTAMKGFNYMKEEFASGTFTKKEVERQINLIGKARTKLMFDQKISAEMRKELHYDLRIAAKYKIIDDALLSVSDYKFKEIKYTEFKSADTGDLVPVYAISDLHYGLIIKIKNNEYDLDVAQRRMWQIADFIIRDIKLNGYKEFIIFDGGDIIEGSGNLRASQWLSTVMTMTQQVASSADFMTNFYMYLNNKLSDMARPVKGHIYMVSSANHTQLRIGNTKRDEVENDDVSILIADIIKKNIGYGGESIFTSRKADSIDKYDNEIEKDDYTINFEYADEHLIDINGVKVFLTHGHQYKYASNLHNVLSNRENIIIDIVYSGHYHSLSENTVGSRGKMNKKKIFLPSVCGDTSYAHRLGYSSMPGALKSVFSNIYGNIGNIFIPVD